MSRESIEEAIADAEKQEPVAWMYTSQWKSNERFITTYQSELTTYKADKVWPLYTAPPKQWVGLTEPELHEINPTWPAPGQHWEYEDVLAFVRAVEAKLKEKNT